jgi:hypothetical protein
VFADLVLVPSVLIVLLVISWYAAYRSYSQNNPQVTVSKILAFWFGMVLFTVIVVSTIFLGRVAPIPFDGSIGGFIAYFSLGLIFGIGVMASIDILVEQKAAAIFIAVLSSMSLAGLYYYALTFAASNPILIIVLGVLLGGLFYAVFIRTPVFFVNLRLSNLVRIIVWVGAISALFATAYTIISLAYPHSGALLPGLQPLVSPTAIPSVRPQH